MIAQLYTSPDNVVYTFGGSACGYVPPNYNVTIANTLTSFGSGYASFPLPDPKGSAYFEIRFGGQLLHSAWFKGERGSSTYSVPSGSVITVSSTATPYTRNYISSNGGFNASSHLLSDFTLSAQRNVNGNITADIRYVPNVIEVRGHWSGRVRDTKAAYAYMNFTGDFDLSPEAPWNHGYSAMSGIMRSLGIRTASGNIAPSGFTVVSGVYLTASNPVYKGYGRGGTANRMFFNSDGYSKTIMSAFGQSASGNNGAALWGKYKSGVVDWNHRPYVTCNGVPDSVASGTYSSYPTAYGCANYLNFLAY